MQWWCNKSTDEILDHLGLLNQSLLFERLKAFRAGCHYPSFVPAIHNWWVIVRSWEEAAEEIKLLLQPFFKAP